MPKEQKAFSTLADYLPDNTLPLIMPYIEQHKVQLTITRKRSTVLGDYRHPYGGKGHRISVNGDLNKYSFLITLLHEMAHLETYVTHGNKVQPHGKEWKQLFANILQYFLEKKIFDPVVEQALFKSISNPAASSCADENLLRTLKKYDNIKKSATLVEALELGEQFIIANNRVFVRGEKIRKRFKCVELSSKKWYLFSGLFEVKRVNS
jgi:SprT protein